jgi:hypothetical protein
MKNNIWRSRAMVTLGVLLLAVLAGSALLYRAMWAAPQ